MQKQNPTFLVCSSNWFPWCRYSHGWFTNSLKPGPKVSEYLTICSCKHLGVKPKHSRESLYGLPLTYTASLGNRLVLGKMEKEWERADGHGQRKERDDKFIYSSSPSTEAYWVPAKYQACSVCLDTGWGRGAGSLSLKSPECVGVRETYKQVAEHAM